MQTILKTIGIVLAAALIVVGAADGHILKLKDGRILKGNFVGATSESIHFFVEGDTIRVFPIDDILSLHFSMASLGAAPLAPAEPIRIPPGTVIRVRLHADLGSIESNAGQTFFASLAEDLALDGDVLSAQGKRVFGRVRKVVKPKRSRDRAVVEIVVTDLTIMGKKQPVITDSFGVTNDGQGTVNITGTGQAIGAGVADFWNDRNVKIPRGTILEFHVTQPVVIRR
jgi:hypothetical protein